MSDRKLTKTVDSRGMVAYEGAAPVFPEGRAATKVQKLAQMRQILLAHPNGIKVKTLAGMLGVDEVTADRYVKELGAVLAGTGRGFYTLPVSQDDLDIARAAIQRAIVDGKIEQTDVDLAAEVIRYAQHRR